MKPNIPHIVIALIVGVCLGMVIERLILTQNPFASEQVQPKSVQDDFFNSQTATVHGKVTKVDGRMITVTNEKNITESLTLDDAVVIYHFNSSTNQASSSSDIKSIDTDLPALLSINKSGDTLKVVTISYLPSANPTSKPTIKPTATPKNK
jgi:hypothetical protein